MQKHTDLFLWFKVQQLDCKDTALHTLGGMGYLEVVLYEQRSVLWEDLCEPSLFPPLVQVTHNDLAMFSRLTWYPNTLPADSSLAVAEWRPRLPAISTSVPGHPNSTHILNPV